MDVLPYQKFDSFIICTTGLHGNVSVLSVSLVADFLKYLFYVESISLSPIILFHLV